MNTGLGGRVCLWYEKITFLITFSSEIDVISLSLLKHERVETAFLSKKYRVYSYAKRFFLQNEKTFFTRASFNVKLSITQYFH